MNTRKRLAAMRMVRQDSPAVLGPANPACVIGPGQSCEHALVDQAINQSLYDYEVAVSGRFDVIVDTLRQVSALQHESNFTQGAQAIAMSKLGYQLPARILDEAWVSGLDLRSLYSHCVIRSFKITVDQAAHDQQALRERTPLNQRFFLSCGYHTIDVSPCADGRLQGALPFVFRFAPNDAVWVKAYAGALFDVESDIGDWSQRELDRLSGAIAGGEQANYLKVAVYHFSSSKPAQQGCAAHGSCDSVATQAALDRLVELQSAIENRFGRGAAPAVLLIGVDTDTDAIRVHLPDELGHMSAYRYADSAALYRDTLGMSAMAAQVAVESAVSKVDRMDGWGQGTGVMQSGMRRLVMALLEANLSQIEYVIQHHDGRYADIGHNERFICVGESLSEVQFRNMFYFAHLTTVEDGAADVDIGVKIFTGLNVARGLPMPVLVHFHYSSKLPGSRVRALARCRRVKNAIEARYQSLHQRGFLHCCTAVSDTEGSERCTLIEDQAIESGH